jgi:predicted dehydrogenase
MKRREFIASMGAMAFTAASYSRILGANDRLGVALVGSGRRGRLVMGKMLKTGRCNLVMLCDVWDQQMQRTRKELSLSQTKEVYALEDVLANKDVEAVLIATPDHLHKDYTVEAINSGRHVFLEKPATLHYEEGVPILNAVRNSGKICQTGTQQRSGSHYRNVKEEFFSGSKKIGDIVFVKSQWSDFPWQRRQIAPQPQPKNFHWERFLGPAPKTPYNWAHYDAWRNYKQYGAGILSDLLTHWADVAQWYMEDANPMNAVVSGGIYYMKDDRTNPDTVNSILQYKDGWNFSFECSIMPVKDERASVLFHGTEGKLEIFRGGYIYTPHGKAPQQVEAKTDIDLEHVTDFFDAIKHNRKPSADIEIGLEAIKPAHLAVAAYWSGKRMGFSQDMTKIVVK